jgi:hypothetical protein
MKGQVGLEGNTVVRPRRMPVPEGRIIQHRARRRDAASCSNQAKGQERWFHHAWYNGRFRRFSYMLYLSN